MKCEGRPEGRLFALGKNMRKHLTVVVLAVMIFWFPLNTSLWAASARGSATSVLFRLLPSVGIEGNFAALGQMSGITFGDRVFGQPDYFKEIGKYYLTASPLYELGSEYLFDERNALRMGVGWDRRLLRFSYLKDRAPSNVDYRSEFSFITLALGYEYLGWRGITWGGGLQYNFLVGNDSKIIYDGKEYSSMLDDAQDSASIFLTMGGRLSLVHGHELRLDLRLYLDIFSMYPGAENRYLSMISFAGLSCALSWALPVAWR
jgi:hypothetical protein